MICTRQHGKVKRKKKKKGKNHTAFDLLASLAHLFWVTSYELPIRWVVSHHQAYHLHGKIRLSCESSVCDDRHGVGGWTENLTCISGNIGEHFDAR